MLRPDEDVTRKGNIPYSLMNRDAKKILLANPTPTQQISIEGNFLNVMKAIYYLLDFL